MRYHPVSIVWQCRLDVSAYLALGQQVELGEHACTDCGQLRGWVLALGARARHRAAVDSTLSVLEVPALARAAA